MSTTVVEPEGLFNFADWLLQRNRSRPTRTAFIDDTERLTYGALDDRVRRAAAGMLAAGLRRDERVLLLMHDNVDWPVMFLGALYAGVVPVAVNTLLTAEDYAYMLQHSRARAAWVSPALLPTLHQAMAQ
ncbi:MAG: AMP-binding protein, partial [Burkholderiaceae bacterium]